ncbi:hypothetical protein TrVFT333_006046 [Trichoderma virens FT-333]|nr:hypothetical protein TrVFT333_006046 [Trichoderma virens FT-333]
MILDDEADTNSSQSPLFGDGFIHPISKSPISRPPVSSIKVFARDLSDYAEFTREFFCERNDEKWLPDTPPDILSNISYPCSCPGGYNAPPPLEIIGSGPNGLVTIGDYVCAVVPWLRSLKNEILNANNDLIGRDLMEYPSDRKCYVDSVLTNEITLIWYESDEKMTEYWAYQARCAREYREAVARGSTVQMDNIVEGQHRSVR